MRGRARLLAAGALVLALAAAALVRVQRQQWDLKVYMECSRTLAAGGDPYASEPLVDNSRFQCLYPPLATDLYRPFAALDGLGGAAGERAWAFLKVLSLAALLWLWRRWILRPGPDRWRVLAVATLYGSPFWSDFVSGNAGSFEHLVLWAGLAAFVAGRDWLCAATLAVSAQPKLLPVALLPLLLAAPRPDRRAFVFGGVLALGLFALNQAIHPGLARSFFAHLADPTAAWHFERGPNNVAFVGLVQHVLETATGQRMPAMAWAQRAHVLWSLAVAALTALALRRRLAAPGSDEDKRRDATLLYCAAYCLVVPRLKDYSFLLLLPPTLAALESDAAPALKAGIVVCALLNSTKALAEKAGLGPWSLFAGYFKLYAAILVWVALVFPRRPAASERA